MYESKHICSSRVEATNINGWSYTNDILHRFSNIDVNFYYYGQDFNSYDLFLFSFTIYDCTVYSFVLPAYWPRWTVWYCLVSHANLTSHVGRHRHCFLTFAFSDRCRMVSEISWFFDKIHSYHFLPILVKCISNRWYHLIDNEFVITPYLRSHVWLWVTRWNQGPLKCVHWWFLFLNTWIP